MAHPEPRTLSDCVDAQAGPRGLDLALPVSIRVDVRRTSRLWAWGQRMIAVLACVALIPTFLVLYLPVRITSRGSFLFAQKRPGYRGRPLTVIKIRTMRAGSEVSTALGTSRRSPEITRIGSVLRDLKLDELPQLFNVARGEMELVGPRPIPTALDQELRRHIPGFELRYQVKPGLTNVSQVTVLDNKLGDRLIADWKLRFEGELHYIKNKSFTYDLVVLAMTAAFVGRKLLARLR